MNFGSLHYFLGIKTIENDLKSPHSAGSQFGPWPQPFGCGGLPRAASRKAARPQPGGLIQPKSGPHAARAMGARGHRT
jgi:hypothetical protein